MRLIPMKGGDEYDALTRWKRFLRWRPGERKAIKRGYNKRARRVARERIAKWLSEIPPRGMGASST
jgi:hypothetical protein